VAVTVPVDPARRSTTSREALAPVRLEWDDIQGDVLRGYGFDHAHHLVLELLDPDAARGWLCDLVPQVTPATRWTTRPTTTLNVAFTHRGLRALGLDREALDTFPADFRGGMTARAKRHVGDVGPDSSERWEPLGVHHPAAHVLVMVHAASAEVCGARAAEVRTDAVASGLEVVHTERLANLPLGTGPHAADRMAEHFGFADGISQPAVEGAIEPSVVRGHGTPLSDGRWRAVRAGEFVLGYPDEEEEAPPLPSPPELARNGSYLVVRKLGQDVAGFRRLVVAQAERHGIEPGMLAAKLVGRWGDGSPLAASTSERDGDRTALNDFRYVDDELGQGCPVGSHIRRVNPRDALSLAPELVSRHRLLRRGMPYGPPLPDGALDDDGVPRGLMFMAYCASISRQFEFVQREWMNDGNIFGVGRTPDPIAGHGSAPRRFAFPLPGRDPVVLGGLPRLVRVLGGEYLFLPGLRGLRYLSKPREDQGRWARA
jgi:Dyp-type peroxidase family